MRFSVRVVELPKDGQLVWVPVGFGSATPSLVAQGRDTAALRRSLVAALRKRCETLPPAALVRQLEGHHFELVRARVRLSANDGSRRVRHDLVLPLFVERLTVAPEEDPLTIAYHPLRPSRWFPVPDDAAGELKDRVGAAAERWLPELYADLDLEAQQELRAEGRARLRIVAFSAETPALVDRAPERGPFADLEVSAFRGDKPKRRSRGFGTIRKIGEDLSERAVDGTLPLGRPREPFRTTLLQLVGPGAAARRSVVLVGESGVGKTTMIQRLVADLIAHDGFESHGNLDRVTRVFRISGQRILAGMSFVGDWERRALAVLAEARAGNVMLVVDDLVDFGRLGRSRDGDRTLADLFRGAVASGEVTLVGECSPGAWARLEAEAPTFAASFTTVPVPPADAVEKLLMLGQRGRELEEAQQATLEADGIEALLRLGPVVHPGTAQPGATLGLLTQVEGILGQPEVLTLARERTGLPQSLLWPGAGEAFTAEALRWRLGSRVLGQSEAVEAGLAAILKLQAGLADPGRPVATYLFTGPTGTGKTELSKALAEQLFGSRERLLRLDMGEFGGADAVGRLIGNAWEPRGRLTEAIRAQPFAVVLLDEIEKAHPAVHQLLLQLLDEGRLTDASGERADFRRALIIMTSNLGAQASATIGYGVDDAGRVARDRRADALRAVREFFPPELFNRIDRVVAFHPLTAEVAERIAAKELAELFTRPGLVQRQVFAFATPSATRKMVEEAFDVRYGARSVKRFLESEVGFRLAEHLATEPPERGGAAMRTVRVYDAGDRFALQVETLRETSVDEAPRRLAPLRDASTEELQRALEEARGYVESIRDGELGATLREARGAALAAFQAGRASSALFVLESFLQDLESFAAELEHLVVAPEGRARQET